MARIAGVDLPNNKRVEIGITYIYGIGLATSKKILAETGVDPCLLRRDGLQPLCLAAQDDGL